MYKTFAGAAVALTITSNAFAASASDNMTASPAENLNFKEMQACLLHLEMLSKIPGPPFSVTKYEGRTNSVVRHKTVRFMFHKGLNTRISCTFTPARAEHDDFFSYPTVGVRNYTDGISVTTRLEPKGDEMLFVFADVDGNYLRAKTLKDRGGDHIGERKDVPPDYRPSARINNLITRGTDIYKTCMEPKP